MGNAEGKGRIKDNGERKQEMKGKKKGKEEESEI